MFFPILPFLISTKFPTLDPDLKTVPGRSLAKGPILTLFSILTFSRCENDIIFTLLKQSFYDADWYKNNEGKTDETNLSLSAINSNSELPKIIEVRDKLRVLLAQKIEKEMGIKFLIKGQGDEYQRINEIKRGGSKLIIPINYPKPFNVDDPFKNNNISLSQLKHWEMAPSNPYFLEKNGINFSITSGAINKVSFGKFLKSSVIM